MVKTELEIVDLAEEIMREEQVKQDLIFNTGQLVAEADPSGLVLRCLDENGSDLLEPVDITPLAHRQLGTFLGIPAKYYDKMNQEDTGLLAQNINTWFQKYGTFRMVRILDGFARAFLSSSYRRIDNLNILHAVLPVLGEVPEIQFVSCGVTKNKMYLKVVNPNVEAELTEGYVVQGGVIITNSEVGQGAFSIKPMLFCVRDGLAFADAEDQIRKIHRGRQMDVSENQVLEPEAQLDREDLEFLRDIQDLVRNALGGPTFHDKVERMREATGAVMEESLAPHLLEVAGKSFGVTESERKGVLHYLTEGQDWTRYGLASAVAQVSQDAEDYDRASELEETSYSLLVMSNNQWTGINVAAASMQAVA